MKKLLIGLFLLNTAVISFGQKSDPDAKKVLDAVSAKFKSFKTVLANFTYKLESSAGKALHTEKGTVTMKGTKYRLSFSGKEVWCDGNTVWSYDKPSNEVTVSKLDAGGASFTPQKLFSNFYDKDFLYKLNGEKKEGAKTFQEIEMTPTDKTKSFSKIYVLVDKNAKTLYSTRVLETSGSRVNYTVNTMKSNVEAADAQFVFDKSKYPGVEVVDLQ